MDNARAEQITNELKRRGVIGECPMCRNHKFEVKGTSMMELDNRGEGLKGILDKLDGKGEFGPHNTVVTICTNCGFIARFSLKAIGIEIRQVT